MSRSVPEWIGKTDDTPVPPRVIERVRQRDNNRCCGCDRDLRSESAQCDHTVALVNGGENRERNLQTLCLWCHGKKTKRDVAIKARTSRVRRAHYGIRRKGRSSFQTNKDGLFKKKITGEVERRPQR